MLTVDVHLQHMGDHEQRDEEALQDPGASQAGTHSLLLEQAGHSRGGERRRQDWQAHRWNRRKNPLWAGGKSSEIKFRSIQCFPFWKRLLQFPRDNVPSPAEVERHGCQPARQQRQVHRVDSRGTLSPLILETQEGRIMSAARSRPWWTRIIFIRWSLQSVPTNVLEAYHLTSMTLEYRRECRQSNLLESLTSRAASTASEGSSSCSARKVRGGPDLEFVHLLRMEPDKAEIVRARTEWHSKSLIMNWSTQSIYGMRRLQAPAQDLFGSSCFSSIVSITSLSLFFCILFYFFLSAKLIKLIFGIYIRAHQYCINGYRFAGSVWGCNLNRETTRTYCMGCVQRPKFQPCPC